MEHQQSIETLTEERNRLKEELEKLTSASGRTESQQEKLTQVNNKLKRALQSLKDKIHRVVLARPELFTDVGDETSERLDHLISTLETQATQMETMQAERSQIEEQLREERTTLQK